MSGHLFLRDALARVPPHGAVMAMADGARRRSVLVVPAHDGDAPSGSQI
jgi:hypothetical protein